MTDPRAILTDREREIVSGDADVSDSYRYQTVSRVRNRFDRLEDDLAALESHGDLANEFRETVCEERAHQDTLFYLLNIHQDLAEALEDELRYGEGVPQLARISRALKTRDYEISDDEFVAELIDYLEEYDERYSDIQQNNDGDEE